MSRGKAAIGKGENPDLPKAGDLLDSVLKALEKAPAKIEEAPLTYEDEYRRQFKKHAIESEEQYAHLNGLIDHYKHKGYWSFFLMAVMASMILFQAFLLIQVGFGYWDFTEYEWLLPLLLVQNLAQIIGLAVFVVKALFKEMRKP